MLTRRQEIDIADQARVMLLLIQWKNNTASLRYAVCGLQTDVMTVLYFSDEIPGNIGKGVCIFGCVHDDGV